MVVAVAVFRMKHVFDRIHPERPFQFSSISIVIAQSSQMQ